MKVLHVQFVSPACGMAGAEQVVFNLAAAMKERYRFDTHVAVNECRLAHALRAHRIPVSVIDRDKYRCVSTLLQFRKIIHDFKPDLVHSHHRYATFLLDLFFKKTCPILHTEHLWRCDKQLFFRPGHFVAAVSEAVRENLMSRYHVPEGQVKTIPNAVRAMIPDPVRLREMNQKYPRRKDDVFAACLGRLEDQKGHRYLIDAVSRLPPLYRSRLKIFLAGEGSLKSILQSLANARGIGKNIVFLDYFPHIAELLAISDFLVLPSLYEGMPLVVIEAYSASRPVIATDIPGTHEIVIQGKTGVLVPPRNGEALAQSMQDAMDSIGTYRDMGQAAYRLWQEKFSFEKMLERYADLYRQILQNKKRELS